MSRIKSFLWLYQAFRSGQGGAGLLLSLPSSVVPIRSAGKAMMAVFIVGLATTSLLFLTGAPAAGSPLDLKRFGQELFSSGSWAPSPTEGPVSPTYIVGPGDELVIYITGTVNERHTVSVDEEGRIILSKAGPLHVGGLTFAEVRSLLESVLLQYYSGVQITVAMSSLRDVDVFVVGEVEKPGLYRLRSSGAVLHVLTEAGGIKSTGSLRDVRVLRDGAVAATIDLYELYFTGSLPANLRIEDGDILFVPVSGPTVSIYGEIRRPAIYELKAGETLEDLVNFAGGFKPAADRSAIQVERFGSGTGASEETPRIEVVSNAPLTMVLQDGDRVYVRPVPEYSLRRTVRVRGEVAYPGLYELPGDATLGDLIARAGGLTENAYLYAATLTRTSVRTEQRQFLEDVARAELAYIERERARLDEMPLTADERERRWRALEHRAAVVELIRSRSIDGRIILDIDAAAVELPDTVASLPLETGDELYVPPYSDTVLVAGAVYGPEAVLFAPGQSIDYYLRQVGGPLREADLDGIYVIKANGRIETTFTGFSDVQAGDAIVVPFRLDLDPIFETRGTTWEVND